MYGNYIMKPTTDRTISTNKLDIIICD